MLLCKVRSVQCAIVIGSEKSAVHNGAIGLLIYGDVQQPRRGPCLVVTNVCPPEIVANVNTCHEIHCMQCRSGELLTRVRTREAPVTVTGYRGHNGRTLPYVDACRGKYVSTRNVMSDRLYVHI
jgi:hypothetical protein